MGIEEVINDIYSKNPSCAKPNGETSIIYFLRDGAGWRRYNWSLRDGEWTLSAGAVFASYGTGCITKEEMLEIYVPKPKEGMEGFIEQATGADGINNDNLWENIKPVVPALIIGVLFALGVMVIERLVNKASKGKAE